MSSSNSNDNTPKKRGRKQGGKNLTEDHYYFLCKMYVQCAADLGHSSSMVSEKVQLNQHKNCISFLLALRLAFHLFFDYFRSEFHMSGRDDESLWHSLRCKILEKKVKIYYQLYLVGRVQRNIYQKWWSFRSSP